MMKVNKWTLGLAAVGLVSIPAVVQAEEKPNQLLTALSSTTISGYVDTSAQWTLGSGNANPPGYSYNTPAKQDGFNVNVVDLQLEKPLDEGTWSAGYKVELWFGPNAAGLGNDTGLGGGGNDVALKQGYVALRAPVGNGLDIKLGTWDTIIGYEVANSGSNPNYTRSYGYTLEPTSQTGVLASYQISKVVGISGGVANLWSPGIGGGVDRSPRSQSKKTYLGSITLTAPDSWGDLAGSAFYAGIVDGYNTSVGNDVTSYYLGVTLATPIKALKVGAAWDYVNGHDNNFGAAGNFETAPGQRVSNGGYAQSIALYASVQATEKLSFHARGEWTKLSLGDDVSAASPTALANIPTSEIWSLTGTIQYDLWANVLSRLEVRWDHASSHDSFGGTTSGEPRKQNEVIVAANLIYKF